MSYEHESRLNRIVNFTFDKRTPVVRFRENNLIFYSAISNDVNELLEWRYEAILDKEFNTSIVLVLKTANEPMKQVNALFTDDNDVFGKQLNLTSYDPDFYKTRSYYHYGDELITL